MNHDNVDHGRRLRQRFGLAIGFAALAGSIIAAYDSPATGYEVSIYQATPGAFWIGVGIALFAALYVAFDVGSGHLRSWALGLSGLAVFSVAALPVIRGYHFYGLGDAMTHWGWVRFLANGDLYVLDLLYPGVHSIAGFTSHLTGVTYPHAILVVVLAFGLVFLSFVPLAASVLDARAALTIGAFAGLLFLPINNVSVYFMVHPSTQAIMFVPAMLYLVLRYVTDDGEGSMLTSRFGALLALSLVAFVFVHPQQAVNLFLLIGAIAFLQFGYRLIRRDHPISRHRPLYAHTAILAIALFAWTPRHPMAGGAASTLFEQVATFSFQPGAETTQRGTSLTAIGGSIEELFLKLFLVAAVFCLFAGILMLANLFGWLDTDKPHANAAITYLTFGLVPVFCLFALFFLAGYETQHFRVVGFMIAILTVLGAVAIARGAGYLSRRFSPESARAVVAVVFVLAISLSLPVLYASPYIYQNTNHVTQTQVSGFDTAFDHRSEEIRFTGIRSPGIRFGDALLGYEDRSQFARPASTGGPEYASQSIYETMDENETFSAATVQETYEEPHYLPVTTTDYEREVDAYRGVRFSRQGFDSLETRPGVHRVHSNDEFRMYLVE